MIVTHKTTDEDTATQAIIKSLEKDEYCLSDGFGYYTGEDYDATMRKVARHILVALKKSREGKR